MKFLDVIIDGYNFLKTTGLMDLQVDDSELEKGRRRLIKLLVKAFPEPSERNKLNVVFDSATLLDLPVALNMEGIKVRFAKGYDSADELIMELIGKHPVAKRLLVVSSDHEIQTCANRRKASYVDSDAWLDELEKKMESQTSDGAQSDEVPPDKTEIEDSEYWLRVFSDESYSDSKDDTGLELTPKSSNKPESKRPADDSANRQDEKEPEETGPKEKDAAQGDDELEGWDEIFPPGYGEDLLD